MKITIDAKKDKIPLPTRGSGKSNTLLYHLLKWLESYNLGEPVTYEVGFTELCINEKDEVIVRGKRAKTNVIDDCSMLDKEILRQILKYSEQ